MFQRKQLRGRAAWWTWLLGHIMYLADSSNRARASLAYLSVGHGARVITGEGMSLPAAVEEHEDTRVRIVR